MKKVLVIVGPTASGKTDLSLKLAKHFNGEIISGDSIQITTVVTGTGSVTVSAVGYMSKTDATATTSANPQVF